MISSVFELPPLDLQLVADEIHIWMGDLDQAAAVHYQFLQMLSVDEHMRAGRFHFERDQKRFIARHGILRELLGSYLGVKANEIRLSMGKNGKPRIAETSGKGTVHFNLSHSDGLALFAFARNHEIGVDLEHIRDISEMEQIVDRFFSPGEKTFLRVLPQNLRRNAFFNCWTRKEAFIKAIGVGLSWSLDKFDVAPVSGEGETPPISARDLGEDADWAIHTLKPDSEFVGALAVKCRGVALRCFSWMAAGANLRTVADKTVHLEAVR